MSHVLKGSLRRKSAHLFFQNFLKTRSILLFMKKDQNQEKRIPCFSAGGKTSCFSGSNGRFVAVSGEGDYCSI